VLGQTRWLAGYLAKKIEVTLPRSSVADHLTQTTHTPPLTPPKELSSTNFRKKFSIFCKRQHCLSFNRCVAILARAFAGNDPDNSNDPIAD
jgi:hypothetical protein